MSSTGRFPLVQPYVTTLARLAAGVIMIWAGVAKAQDLPASVRAVRAYRILPEAVVPFVGNVLPFLEMALGFFLVAGLLTRAAALVYLAMMAAFMIGVGYAWAKGLQIDCGCFGGGGDLAEGETANYVGHMLERVGFAALGAWVAWFPRSALSLDGWLRGPTGADAEE